MMMSMSKDGLYNSSQIYGHRAGDPECKYTAMGDLGQELQRRVREDPMTCFKKLGAVEDTNNTMSTHSHSSSKPSSKPSAQQTFLRNGMNYEQSTTND